MAREPKTKPTNASVEDFLDAVDNPRRREDGKAVAALMAEITGEAPVMWGPSIVGFGSYRGSTGDWPVVAFSPRKANLVLYIPRGFTGADEVLARLGKFRAGAGCLYLNRLSDLDTGELRRLVEMSVRYMRATYAA